MVRRAITPPKTEDISAAILAGGTSRRMGVDKALLLHGGKPLIQWVCEAVAKVFVNVFLVTGDPARLSVPWIPAVPDRITGQGPLGGIDAALRHAPTEFTFITGCDMPFLSPAVLRFLAARAHGCDLVVPSGPNGLEPLCAIYGKGCLPFVEESLTAGQRDVFHLIDRVHALVVPAVEIATMDPEFLSFLNVNTPDDYRQLKKKDNRGKGNP
ncbi:MAG: molybdenum cofactor guanylyltransferase [Candidatus Deferrimicrobium sp.]|nr:molybdenum cofactor guanylyltransferase [Candidatus Deferrimicrobium sp.]